MKTKDMFTFVKNFHTRPKKDKYGVLAIWYTDALMADSGKFCVLSCLERQSEQPFVLLKLSNKFTLITYAFNTYQPSMQKSVLLTLSKKNHCNHMYF